MKTISRLACSLLLLGSFSCALTSCEQEPDFSNAGYIAELATLDCYYHNVAETTKPGRFLFDDIELWFEYSAVVPMGIDASKVSAGAPDENGVVTVYLPEAEVLGDPVIDEDSITSPISNEGFFEGELTTEEKTKALDNAQKKILKKAESDEVLLHQAHERAKDLLERYVVNVGEALGKHYEVEFEVVK